MVPPVSAIPSTSVIIPSGGATLSGTQEVLDAKASDPVGVTNVQYELTGGSLNNTVIATGAPSLYGWLASFDTTTVPNGTYALESTATDSGGSSANSAPVTVTVDNAPPSTAVLVPSNGATLAGLQWFDGSASPGVSSVQYELTGGSLNHTVISTAGPTYYGWLGGFDTTTVPNGTYTLQSVASYGGGVTGTSPGITITVNNAPPSTAVLVPSNGATVSGGQWFDASASPGVSSVAYELTGGSLNHTVITTATPTYFGWLGGFDSTTVANGTYTLQSVASYGGGVTGTSAGITIVVAN
jgi:hypothetical protein